jgi:hypothetical protein
MADNREKRGKNGGRDRHEHRRPTPEGRERLDRWLQRTAELAGVTEVPKVTAAVNGDDERGYYYDASAAPGCGSGKRADDVAEVVRAPLFFLSKACNFRNSSVAVSPFTGEWLQEFETWVKEGHEILACDAEVTVESESGRNEDGRWWLDVIVRCENAGRLITYEGDKGVIVQAMRKLGSFIAWRRGIAKFNLDVRGPSRNRFAESATGTVGEDDPGTDESTGSDDPTPSSADV